MRSLVTGGTGFVGSNLCRRLVTDGHEVHLLLRPTARLWRLADLVENVYVHYAAIEDADAIDRLFRKICPEWVFHLAVHGAYSFETDVTAMITTNVLGTSHLLRGALAVGCDAFVNTGSSSEYGLKDHAPLEDEAIEPNSYYAVTKASATWLCRFAAKQHNAHIPTLRLYSVYGPYEDPRRLMPTLIGCALRGVWPPLVAPWVARDYVYVDDVVDAYLRAARIRGQEPGAVYNVGTGVQTSLKELAAIVQRLFDVPGEPDWGTYAARGWDTGQWVASPQKIRACLDWEPRHDLEAGLREMAAWMRAHPDHYPHVGSGASSST